MCIYSIYIYIPIIGDIQFLYLSLYMHVFQLVEHYKHQQQIVETNLDFLTHSIGKDVYIMYIYVYNFY